MSNPATVLIVDDDPEIIEQVTSFLTRSGYNVLSAATGAEALARAADARPELILLDIGLGDADGLELLDGLLKPAAAGDEVQSPTIFMLTARYDIEAVETALRRGASDYLMKPIDLRHLASVVAQVLG